jgi:hypothetical protein
MFSNKTAINVYKYITKKYSLYIKAKETNKDLIVRYLYNNLDLILATIVTLYLIYNIIDDFIAKTYTTKS